MAVETASATSEPPPGGHPPALRVHLLGRFEVAHGDAPVPRDAWRRRRPADLLKLLAATSGHAIPRGEMVATLWPGKDAASGANNLHRALYDLRQILGGRFADVEDGTVRLAPGVWVDVDAFEASSRGDRAALQAAVALYRGDLVPEDRDVPWLSARREELRRRYASAAYPLAIERAGRDPAGAVPLLRRSLEVEPGNEEAWRLLVRLLAETGRRADALRQYDACEAALRAATGRGAGAETLALVAAVVRGDVGPRTRPREWDGVRRAARRFCGTPDLGPLRGRGAMRVLLESLLEQGHGMIVLLGEAGVGKTRLALEGARLAQERGAVVLSGAGGPSPGSILRGAIADLAEVQGLPIPDPFLETQREAALDPELSRRRLFEAVPRLLRGVGRGRPVFLVAEDLHLADESSLNLLHRLAREAASVPLVVVGTCREDRVVAGSPVQMFLAHADGEALARGVRVPRLALSATREILGDVMPKPPSDGLALEIHRATDGNPFYVEQLARAWQDGDREGLAGGPAAAVRGLLARPGRRAQPVLAAGAVLGNDIDHDMLRAVTGLSGHDLLQAVEPCLEARLLTSQGDSYRFRHPLLRDAAYALVPAEARAGLHRAAADALDARAAAAGDRSRWLEAIAHHRRAAGQHALAVGPLLAVGRDAVERGAVAEGVRYMEQALESAEVGRAGEETRLDLLESLARGHLALGSLGGVERALSAGPGADGARPWPPGEARQARFHRLLALARIASGQVDGAVALLGDAPRGDEAAAERAEALRLRAVVARHRGHESEALDLLAMASEEEERAGDAIPGDPPPFDLELALWEWDLLWDRSAREVELAARRVAVEGRTGRGGGAGALARAVEGACLLARGQLDEGEAALREAADALRSAALPQGEAFARERLGMLLTARGRFDEGLVALGDGLLAAEQASLRWHGLTRLHAALAHNRLASGAWRAAEDAVREASEAAVHHGRCLSCEALLRPASLAVALARGRLEEAEDEARALEALAAGTRARGVAALAASARARVLAAAGRSAESATAAGRAERAWRDIGVEEASWIHTD